MVLVDKRQQFVRHIHEELTGKNNDLPDDKLRGENPLDRFVTGFLFPVFEAEEGIDDEQEELDDTSVNEDEQAQATTVTKRKRYIPPSSAGFSFFISGDSITLRVFYNAIIYTKIEKDERSKYTNTWQRVELTDDKGKEVVFTPTGQKQYEIFKNDGQAKARVDILWRPYADGYIVTVTLLNTQQIQDVDDPKRFVADQNKKA
ncbi:MAG TPA: hypothetical protein ENI84_02780, partial [Thiothrix sp.]|nr:hypothetical protein [Thiothrix sp.]